MHARSFRPSPAMVLAMIALVAAMSGTSWALVRNSVGTKQLKKNAVTAAKKRKNAIRSAHVKDGSLLRQDFAAGVLPDPVVVIPPPTSELTDFDSRSVPRLPPPPPSRATCPLTRRSCSRRSSSRIQRRT